MRTAPRVILYGRHSTSLQNPKSSEDQTASCDKLVESLGGTVVATFHDPAESGYKRGRPGLKKLLAMVANGGADIVVCEALERIARDAEDVAWLAKKLGYHDVELYTVLEHHVDEVKFGVAALIGAIFLKGLIGKTLRGMEAAVAAGRFAGGRAYGYRKKIVVDAKGEPIPGHLEIDPAKAEILTRIFQDFASGLSSVKIATALNEEGIPGPRGGEWNASTIRGNPKALTGILNNPLYQGRLVWGRRQWRRNPDSEMRERRYRLRDRSEWIEVAVPDLRIIDEELWNTVRGEMERRSISGEPEQEQSDKPKSPAGKPRKKHLLSGLIKCSRCGSNYTISGQDYYRCAGQKERGTCGNTLSVRKGTLPAARVMGADLDRLASEDHALAIKRRSQMTADERNPGSRAHHHLLEHLKRGGEDQAIMLVESKACRTAAAEQLLNVARLLLEARQFIGIDLLLCGLGFRDPLEQQPGPVGRSDCRTHEKRQIMLIDEHPLGGDARPIFSVELGGEI